MATFNGAVAGIGDDGYWYATTYQNNSPSDRIGNITGQSISGFWRIDNVTLEGTINTAVLTLTGGGNDSGTTCAVRIRAELANDPTAPTSAADGNSRTLTTAFVDWTVPAFVNGTTYNPPDVSAIIQELVDAGYTYTGTQAITFFILDNGSTSNVNRRIRSYDGFPANSVSIAVDYTTTNPPPTIVPVTADATTFNTTQPALRFTGSDAEDLTYEIQITDDPTGFNGGGNIITAQMTDVGTGGLIHPNPLTSTLTWQGEIQVDDRPGQSLQARGGVLDKVIVYFGSDLLTAGQAVLRFYDTEGVYGVSNTPLNPAAAEDTPTPGWLAESEAMIFGTGQGVQPRTMTFSGINRIRLVQNRVYMWVLDWQADTEDYDNTIEVQANASLPAPGNAYIDGDSVNNGVNLTFDMLYQLYETFVELDKLSDTNPGFINTQSGGDTDPFNPNQTIQYTVQSGEALTNGITYYWRARAKDPSGSNQWSSWTTTRSFDIDTSASGGGESIQSTTSLSLSVGL